MPARLAAQVNVGSSKLALRAQITAVSVLAYFAIVAFLLSVFTDLGVSYLLPGLHSPCTSARRS